MIRLACCLLAFLLAMLVPAIRSDAADGVERAAPTLFELRTYVAEKDKMPALHARFRDHTLRLFEKHGMVNVYYWTPEGAPDTLVYLLSHKDAESAAKSWDAFKNDPEWQDAYKKSHENGPLVKKVETVFLTPTAYSPIQSAAKAKGKVEDPALLYELRTYTTNEGKLPNLNARFRDHTLRLFEKHGMKNGLYGIPTDPKLKETTLVYFIAHKDRAAADQSWADFQNDPDWKKARDASEKDGKILAPMGVKRMFLSPTDYSPHP